METALAIYEGLIQANVPPPTARRVAESLEKDMTSSLATKQDLELMTTRFEALEDRVSLQLQNLESRLVTKLGGLMTLLIGIAATVLALLR
jgi:uncharacterized membrane protein YheB (UPF0754 family)